LKLWYAGVPVGVVKTLTIRGASFTTQKVGRKSMQIFYAWFGASQRVRYIFRADLLLPSRITLLEWCDSNLWCLNRASWVGVLCRFPYDGLPCRCSQAVYCGADIYGQNTPATDLVQDSGVSPGEFQAEFRRPEGFIRCVMMS
jgi:hypothetical protein